MAPRARRAGRICCGTCSREKGRESTPPRCLWHRNQHRQSSNVGHFASAASRVHQLAPPPSRRVGQCKAHGNHKLTGTFSLLFARITSPGSVGGGAVAFRLPSMIWEGREERRRRVPTAMPEGNCTAVGGSIKRGCRGRRCGLRKCRWLSLLRALSLSPSTLYVRSGCVSWGCVGCFSGCSACFLRPWRKKKDLGVRCWGRRALKHTGG
jgi:hypothetical protein